MSSDISNLITEGLCNTLESLLAKKSELKEIKQAIADDISGEFIKVKADFTFEQLTTTFLFVIPALSGSKILNLMMGDDGEVLDKVNDDILDGINEVVSNICGGLTTAINGSNYEDLSGAKFSLDNNSIAQSDEIAQLPNLYRFTVTQDDYELIAFISFKDNFIAHIEEIIQKGHIEIEPEQEEESEPQEESTQKQEGTEKENSTNEEEKSTPEEDKSKEEIKDEEQTSKDDKVEDKQTDEQADTQDEKPSKFAKFKPILSKLKFPKKTDDMDEDELKQLKIKKVIYILVILLLISIITIATLFLLGTFDPPKKEPIKKDVNITKKISKEITIKSNYKKSNIKFNISQINVRRLNKKLALLTKYEIIEDDKTEKLKKQEQQKLIKEKNKQLEEFASHNKEESLTKTNNKKPTKKILKSFITMPTLSIQKYKTFIKDAKAIHANLSICKDKIGKTHIYIGPFATKVNRDMLFTTLQPKLARKCKKLDITMEDFNKNCKF
jgi:chemotaxis protein CheY-P-specific phosphatase CheC